MPSPLSTRTIEILEARIAPATILVTSVLDGNGTGTTLREAIAQANLTPAADLIVFATHGKAGTKAFWAHSIGAKVLAQTARPALLVPIR